MRTARRLLSRALALTAAAAVSCSSPASGPGGAPRTDNPYRVDTTRVPTWSPNDLDFFVHGSMSAEVVPERILRAFQGAYPDLFPGEDLSAFGLIPDERHGLPIGFSRRTLAHLGGQAAVGINCASCHLGEVSPAPGARPVRVLGMTSHFDVQAFYGSVLVGMARTAEPANMRRFLPYYLKAGAPAAGPTARVRLEAAKDADALAAGILQGKLTNQALENQVAAIASAIAEDPTGSQGVAPGAFHVIPADDLRLDAERLKQERFDLVPLVRALLRLLHNVRTALHVPDRLPDTPPPPLGPGRNDAFGVLAQGLLGIKTIDAPAKYGDIWNMADRTWNHWDANNSNGLTRNVMAVIGLGGAVVDGRAVIEPADLLRHAALADRIRPPGYPWTVDARAAGRGARHYQAHCASCHDGPQDDRRLYSPEQVGTDARRVQQWDEVQARRYHTYPDGAFEIPGYQPPRDPPFRVTGKYSAADMAGVWARSPYLHNGSVRTMRDLLTLPAERPRAFRRGSRVYDAAAMGYTDEGAFAFDTAGPGNSNAGHDYGTGLSDAEKRDLIEYLKTR